MQVTRDNQEHLFSGPSNSLTPEKEQLYVLVGAYNHEKFISQALRGALRQRVDVPLKILVWDDASTDGTAKIISRFARKFPRLLVPVFNEVNQHSLGKVWLWELLAMAGHESEGAPPESVYVAICEGDDFWTDNLKLQKQVDFLRQNPSVSFVHHRVKVKTSGVSKSYAEGVARYLRSAARVPEISSGDYFLARNPVATNSVLLRLSSLISYGSITAPSGVFADWLTWFLASRWGPVGHMKEKMSAYRLHPGGMYSGSMAASNQDRHETTLQYLKSLV